MLDFLICVVVGVLLSQDQLRSFVVEQTPECQEQNVQCFLLDDAGFVVMLPTNDTDYEVFDFRNNEFAKYLIGTHWTVLT